MRRLQLAVLATAMQLAQGLSGSLLNMTGCSKRHTKVKKQLKNKCNELKRREKELEAVKEELEAKTTELRQRIRTWRDLGKELEEVKKEPTSKPASSHYL
jgi:Skp family chaperone for outer membrane proteins